jgi:hypothetical protein
MTTPDIAAIAEGLMPHQRTALLECDPADVCVGAGIAIAFMCHGFVEPDDDDTGGAILTAHGIAVRDYLAARS